MHFRAFLLLSLALALGHVSAANQPGIPDINKALGLNLKEGDIMESRQGTAIRQFQWDIPVPYKLSVNLSMHYRGIIWRAFEQFRLKSCIDFKPREAEEFYISVESREGCWSYIGRSSPGGQTLSIGNGCGIKAIVEHEFLHALGLYHEHTRYDRDDYVIIRYENIMKGYESNFKKSSENVSATPYDYYSVMHFDENAFSNGIGSTIITKRPEFQDVIGQLMEMSEYDVIKLNKLYKCNSSISFLDHCSFDDESLCQMSVYSAAQYGWQRLKSVSGISVTDHTYLGKEQNGTSFFMHFSTEGRKEGDAAIIESKTLTPTRACKVQCLQFYYYHSGDESDQLNIWIREYQNEADTRGTLRLMDQIKETPGKFWKLHHVALNANKSFQVAFEGRKGAGKSNGGFSLDDINISETECPHAWQIRDFQNVPSDGSLKWSPLFYSSDGYRFGLWLAVTGNEFYIYVFSASGVYDDQLQWPCPWRQITIQILDQNPHIQKRMSIEQSYTTDPKLTVPDGKYLWGNPQNFNNPVNIDGETVFFGGLTNLIFLTKDLTRREFLKGGDLILLLTIQDISGLLQNDSLPCPKAAVKYFNNPADTSALERPWTTRALSTPQPNSSTTGTRTTVTLMPTKGALFTPQSNSSTTGTRTTATLTPTKGSLFTPQSNSSTTGTRTTATLTPTKGALFTLQSNSSTTGTRTTATLTPTKGALSTPQPNSSTTGTSTTATLGTTEGNFSTPQLNSTTTGTSSTTTLGPTEGALSKSQPNSTTTGTNTKDKLGPTECECVHIFCNSARTASSLIILLLCFLLLEI